MRIIDVRPRRKCLCGILFDTEYDWKEFGCELDAAGLPAIDSELCEIKHLAAGLEISEEDFERIVRESHIKRAKQRALWYVSRGDICKKALSEKLKNSFPDYAAQAASERAEELGLIDDFRYAKRKIERLLSEKKISLKAAVMTVVHEGVDKEIVSVAAEEVEYDGGSLLRELIERKYKGKLSDEKDRQRTFAALLRKGYSYGEIKEAIGEIILDGFEEEY